MIQSACSSSSSLSETANTIFLSCGRLSVNLPHSASTNVLSSVVYTFTVCAGPAALNLLQPAKRKARQARTVTNSFLLIISSDRTLFRFLFFRYRRNLVRRAADKKKRRKKQRQFFTDLFIHEERIPKGSLPCVLPCRHNRV